MFCRGAIVSSLAVAAILVSGCGDDRPAAPSGSAAMAVTIERLNGGPVAIEGSVDELEVQRPDRSWSGQYRIGRDVVRRAGLAAGSYDVTFRRFTCDGTCDHLDPPHPVCRATMVLRSGETTRRLVHVRPRGGCAFTTRTALGRLAGRVTICRRDRLRRCVAPRKGVVVATVPGTPTGVAGELRRDGAFSFATPYGPLALDVRATDGGRHGDCRTHATTEVRAGRTTRLAVRCRRR